MSWYLKALELQHIKATLLELEATAKYLRYSLRTKEYNPDQPRSPPGSATGGQWISSQGQGSSSSGTPATRWIASALEGECLQQYQRDTFLCTMMGSRSCHAQAAERYSACLRGKPIPPLNY